jgi:hAT family C-terminal dimerisation region
MASSVSSERAFSSAGITISKCRNCLKPDVVEALQCLKFMIKRDLFFRFNPSIAADEMQQEDAASELDLEAGDSKGQSWDEMWIVDDDDTDDEAVLGF